MTGNRLFFLFLSTFLFLQPSLAQQKSDFTKAWKQIDSLVENGLPKSAMKVLNNIYNQAKKEKQAPQQLKAVLMKSQLIQMTEEDAWQQNIAAIEAEIRTAPPLVKQVLQSILADLYWEYFKQQRWKIYNRSATLSFNNSDIDTWGVEDFHRKISQLFQASIQPEAILQQCKIQSFETILIPGNSRKLRPTLFDLLAHKALSYFENDESSITNPIGAFLLNDAAALAPAATFIQYNYTTKDSSSHLYQAIKLYQSLLLFHKNDVQPAALIDVDIARISFAERKGSMPYKQQQYKEALEHIFFQHQKQEEAMQAGYLLAKYWQTKGEQYQPGIGTQEDKMALAQAIKMARQVQQAFPKSEGGLNATNILNSLQQPSLQLTAENVNIIGEPFRVLLAFKNTPQIFLRLVAVPQHPEALENQSANTNDDWWQYATRQPFLKAWSQQLPVMNDAREHSVELKIDSLPSGRYLLIASANDAFSLDKNPMSAVQISVSNLAIINDADEVVIVNRKNGEPIDNVKLEVWFKKYDYQIRSYSIYKGETYTSNKKGWLLMNNNNEAEGRPSFLLSKSKDSLLIEDGNIYYNRQYNEYENTKQLNQDSTEWVRRNARYFIFTDRSIYRPGQTLYFKSIGISSYKKNGFPAVVFLPDTLLQILLYDANGKAISTQWLQPNEYGSIAGKFSLPAGVLNGQFRIEVKGPGEMSTQYVRVEAYKRPQFYVTFETPTKSYRANDDISLTGKATAYAGNAINNAMVKYRVYRQARMLYPIMMRGGRGIWPPMFNSANTEIKNGQTLTKTDGSFIIDFKAIPDASISEHWLPSFDFVVEATVTDINGESHESSFNVSAGYRSLQLTLSKTAKDQAADSSQHINISTSNMMGQPIASTVTWKLFQLQAPNKLMRHRLWAAPDTSIMNRATFETFFPNDPYEQEDDFKTWNRYTMLLSDTINTANKTSIHLPAGSLGAGVYLLEASTTDKDGLPVSAIEYLTIYNANKGQLPTPSYLFETAMQGEISPGENAVFLQGSAVSNLPVLQQIKRRKLVGENIRDTLQWIRINGVQSYSYPATETDRGGYTISRFFVQNNRYYSLSWQVQVPWSNKQLKLSFETFRNKLLPGAQETWKVKIAGPNNEQVAAEMLASMYDASLDQIHPHSWPTLNPWPLYYNYNQWNGNSNFRNVSGRLHQQYPEWLRVDKRYDQLMSAVRHISFNDNIVMRKTLAGMVSNQLPAMESALPVEESYDKVFTRNTSQDKALSSNVLNNVVGQKEKNDAAGIIQIRKNFNETAFFLPSLHTNDSGHISFSFTMPEALTKWKLQLLAHTQSLQLAQQIHTVVTQKELMVQPNVPRFFRQGDKLELVSKIVNLGTTEKTGIARLELLNASTMQPIDGWFQNIFPQQYFTVEAGKSIAVSFPIEIPVQYTDALVYRISATAGYHSDGEEMAVPVLSNKMLVTESFPLNMRGTNHQVFEWKKLLQSGNSPTLQHQSFSINYTSNPVWLAIQALPYLMEYPYDCAEQTWNRFYANALAAKIVASMPKVTAVLAQWKGKDTTELLSPLQKNEALKQALLEETPWVLAAKTMTEQQQHIAILFDAIRMQEAGAKSLFELEKLQSANGGFVWFKGGPDDRYMTQYIVAGMGHLKKLNAWPASLESKLQQMASKAIVYLDARMQEDYLRMIKVGRPAKESDNSPHVVQYLYMRSLFANKPIASAHLKAFQYFTNMVQKGWLQYPKPQQAMIAMVMQRNGHKKLATAILNSLQENSITHPEFGMYWKEFNNPGYYWWQSPIESHALLLEAFAEIENNTTRVNNLKTWLLKQKQTSHWPSTRATAEACYALLMTGSNWLETNQTISIKAGNWTINNKDAAAGAGYFSQTQQGDFVSPEKGRITVDIDNNNNPNAEGITSWGAAYWQYFEDLDKITPSVTPLSIRKVLMLQTLTDAGLKLLPVTENTALKTGDKLTIRLEIRTNRSMEYVHVKDMRAACLAPLQAISGYKWQDGLGYYQSGTDASMNFFISYLPKGTYVLEYPLIITHEGSFSNGISSIQCMYEPAFSSHTASERIVVKNH